MADTIDKPQGGESDNSQGGNNGQSQGDGKSMADLLAKIADLEKDNAKYRRAQRENEAATQREKEQQMLEQQKFKELYETQATELSKLKPIAEQNEVITTAFNEMLEGQLKQVPDDIRKKVIDPVRANMSPVEFSKWLRDNLDTFRARQAPPLDGGAQGSGKSTNVQLTADEMQMAQAMGIKPEDYAKRKAEIAARKGEK